MTIPNTVPVGWPIYPFNLTDVYATGETRWQKGTPKICQVISNINNTNSADYITPNRREAGMLIYEKGTNSLYALEADLTSALLVSNGSDTSLPTHLTSVDPRTTITWDGTFNLSIDTSGISDWDEINSVGLDYNEDSEYLTVNINTNKDNYQASTILPLSGSASTISDEIDITNFYIDDVVWGYVDDWTDPIVSADAYTPKTNIDYWNTDNWFVIPSNKKYANDLFIFAPTGVFDESKPDLTNLQDKEYRGNVINFLKTLGVANYMSDFNIYVPKVQQMHARLLKTVQNQEELLPLLEEFKDSATDAFYHYFKNYNGGNKIFIIGHDQGAYQWYFCLRDVIGNNESQINRNLMIKAVLPGMTFTGTVDYYIPYAASQEAQDQHTVACWNSIANDTDISNCYSWSSEAQHSINPLSWLENAESVLDNNLGSIINLKSFENPVHVHGTGAIMQTSWNRKLIKLINYDASDLVDNEMNTYIQAYNSSIGKLCDVGAFAGSIHKMLTEVANGTV